MSDGGCACPRCGVVFHCGANDAPPCACAAVALPAALQAQLRQRDAGCLCVPCLRELAAAAAQAGPGAGR